MFLSRGGYVGDRDRQTEMSLNSLGAIHTKDSFSIPFLGGKWFPGKNEPQTPPLLPSQEERNNFSKGNRGNTLG